MCAMDSYENAGAEADYGVSSKSLRERALEIARQYQKAPAPSEALLWEGLRARKLDGWKFRRQQPIGPFLFDFFCPSARLVVEVDGPINESQREADENRRALLESLGFRFVRVSSTQVETDLPSALAAIRSSLDAPSRH